MKHNFLSILDLSKGEQLEIFNLADMGKDIFKNYSHSLDGMVLASLFFQPSTRTQFSFQSAFLKLGGSIIECAEINGMSVEQYLREYVIPQRDETLGPTVRSGDITEIIVCDLLEFIFNYSVPRYKQKNRSGKNNSEHGTDVIGYKFFDKSKKPTEKDELIATEVKAVLTRSDYSPLEKAIAESKKDEQRLARTIDYCRKRLKELGNIEQSSEVARFLLKPDNNYKLTYAAAGFSSRQTVDQEIELSASGEDLQISSKQKIFYIHGKTLMELAHKIYERCKK